MSESKSSKFKTIMFNVFKVIFILWGVIWALGNIASTILPYKQLVQQSSDILDTNSQVISTTAFEDPSSRGTIEQIFKASFRPFIIISTILVIIGIFVLYNGRTFLEMIYMYNFFMIPRQRRYWGSILDSKTNGAISLASIALIQIVGKEEKLVSRTVSDLDGHYRIRIPDQKGEYVVEVKAEGYKTFRKEIENSVKSIVNRGEYLEDISITRVDQSSASLKSNYYKLKSVLYTPLLVTLFILAIIGFVLYLNQYALKPGIDSLLGAIFFGIAVLWNILISTERLRNQIGKIVDQNHKPIAGVVVKLYGEDNKVDSLISDSNGLVKFQTTAGGYKILVSKDGYLLKNSNKDGFIEVKINNEGYLTKDIVMTQMENLANSSSLMNPFEDK